MKININDLDLDNLEELPIKEKIVKKKKVKEDKEECTTSIKKPYNNISTKESS